MIVDKPIDKSLVAELHPPYYLMHKYWARKPHNIVRSYIEHFTNPGDIVLDPFAGSGVTFIEALLSKRKAIAVDINPIASLITEATVLPFDANKAEEIFHWLEKTIKPDIDSLFSIVCPECHDEALITHAVWENLATCPLCNKELRLGNLEKVRSKYLCSQCKKLVYIPSKYVHDEQLVELWYSCQKCGKRILKENVLAEIDYKKISKSDKHKFKSGIKNGRMFLSNRTLVYEGMTVKSFFTTRNLMALSLLIRAIDKIKDRSLRKLFEFIFTSGVAQASRLIPYRNSLSSGGPAWTVSGFWVPNIHFELNAWNCFANRFKKVIRGKESIGNKLKDNPYQPATSFDELKENKNAMIITHTSTNLNSKLPSDSIDYIFTDPPYGDSVPYLEYSVIWFSWLGLTADFDNEIIISDSKERVKHIADYQALLTSAFTECYRVLKPKRWFSLTFNNRRLDVWNAIISAAVDAGFELVNCLYQVPAVVPAKAQLSKAGSVIGDIILNFRKPNKNKKRDKGKTSRKVEEIILGEAERIIAERVGTATTDEITRGVVIALLKEGPLHISSHDIVKTLKLRFKESKSHWTFHESEKYLIDRYEQLDEIIRRIVIQCFQEGIFDFRKILSEILSQLRNGRTPALRTVVNIYEEMLSVQRKAETLYQDRLPFI